MDVLDENPQVGINYVSGLGSELIADTTLFLLTFFFSCSPFAEYWKLLSFKDNTFLSNDLTRSFSFRKEKST